RERAYFDRFFGPAGEQVEGVDGSTGTGLGWIDVGRRAMGEVDGPYTFWSMRGKAFDTDSGWRIDYHVVTPALAERVTAYRVDRAPSYDTRWSDHSPVIVDYTSGYERGAGGVAARPLLEDARVPYAEPDGGGLPDA
ncbi:hypothetical protein HR12_18475, partial [Microbacterium sp. SUBG005]